MKLPNLPCKQKRSPIHGTGGFATKDLGEGEIFNLIFPKNVGFKGFNHCKKPNIRIVYSSKDDVSIVVLRNITKGKELLVNYFFNIPK